MNDDLQLERDLLYLRENFPELAEAVGNHVGLLKNLRRSTYALSLDVRITVDALERWQ